MSKDFATPIEEKCSTCLVYLHWALAGDPESSDLVSQLESRLRDLPWGRPTFEATARVARGERGEPNAPEPDLESILYRASQAALATNELVESTSRQWIEMNSRMDKMLVYTEKLSGLIRDTIERLHILGDDVSKYEIPEPPK